MVEMAVRSTLHHSYHSLPDIPDQGDAPPPCPLYSRSCSPVNRLFVPSFPFLLLPMPRLQQDGAVIGRPGNSAVYDKAAAGTTHKTRVVVLGSGWGAMSFVKAFTPEMAERYELILLSPRNYFV